MPTSLNDKTVVILGGSSGIGLATARAALDNGAQVTITGRSKARLENAANKLGAAVQTAQFDAADEAGTRAFIDGLASLDHLFITAGALAMDSKLEPDSDDVRPALNTRFWGAFYAAKYAAPKIGEGGSITFMSGSSARRPLPGAAVASASCAAIDTFARALALDLAPLRVNSIQPGYVDTPLFDDLFGDQREEILTATAERLPLKRIGQPEEIADAVLFLMKNSYVTGVNLIVDGGCVLV